MHALNENHDMFSDVAQLGTPHPFERVEDEEELFCS